MSMLGAFFGALARGLSDITADWADITFTSPTTSGTNSNVTTTFTSGGTRTLEVTYSGLVGELEYRINSGTYTSCPSTTTFNVSTGDTVNFRFLDNVNQSATVTVKDQTDGNRTIDTFNVSVSGY